MKTVQIISPHIDDAVLSLCGTIAKIMRKGHRVRITYLFTITNWTNPYNLLNERFGKQIKKITKLRAAEEKNVSEILGYDFELLGFKDLPIRTIHDHSIYQEVKVAIGKLMNRETYYFFPMGHGHPDHNCIGEIGANYLAKNYKVLFYEDMPYTASANYHYEARYNTMVNERMMSPIITKIDALFKADVLREYRSQISELWLRDIMNYSYDILGNSYHERIWEPKGLNAESSLFS